MRNLKRALSLTLASVMLLGMMVVGTSAAGYPDVTEEENIEAIEVLQQVGVMEGDNNGNFNPDDYVTREQMAVIMSKLLNLNYSYYTGTNPFSDVPAWAAPYVAACAANGITSGIGGGMYGAGQNVNAVQAALMMLKALGYFQYQEDFNGDYVLATVKQATEVGLFDKIDSKADQALTRNEVAQMALNALQSEMVTFTGDVGTKIPTAQGDVLIGYKPEYTPRTSTMAKYNAIEGRTSDVATEANHKGQYYIQLGEELYNGELKLTKYDDDIFYRPSRHWEYKGQEIGTYMKKENIKETYTKGVSCRTLYDLIGRNNLNDYEFTYYVDGVDRTGLDLTGTPSNSFNENGILSRQDKNFGVTGNGVLTQVFVDIEKETIDITSIHTWLAKATVDYNKNTEKVTLEVYTGVTKNPNLDTTETPKSVAKADVPEVENVKLDDYLLVTMSGKNKASIAIGDLEVVSIDDVDILTNSTLTKFSNRSDAPNSNEQSEEALFSAVTTDGTEYKSSSRAFYSDEVLELYDNQKLTDKTYNVYLDNYGYAIGVDLYSGGDNYVFIAGVKLNESTISSTYADANAIFLDGTMKTISVNVKDTNKSIKSVLDNSTIGGKKYFQEWGTAPYNVAIAYATMNRWYTYTVNADGVYTLTPAARMLTTSVTSATNATIKCNNVVLNRTDADSADLKSAHAVIATDGAVRVYGNDDSIYIIPEVDNVSDPAVADKVITGVEGVYTGVQDVEIAMDIHTAGQKITTAGGDDTELYDSAYTVYDKNNYIIGSVVLGEARGTSANYAYILSNAKSEELRDGTYYWEFEAVVNGEKTTLTAQSKFKSTMNELRVGHIQELRYTGDYVTSIKNVTVSADAAKDKVYTDVTNPINEKVHEIYDVGHVHSTNDADASNEYECRVDDCTLVNTTNTSEKRLSWDEAVSDGFKSPNLHLEGRTLYLGAEKDWGLTFVDVNVPTVVIQPVDGDIKSVQYESVPAALAVLGDADGDDTNGKLGFDGRIVAVLDNTGRAKWAVIISDTNVETVGADKTGISVDIKIERYVKENDGEVMFSESIVKKTTKSFDYTVGSVKGWNIDIEDGAPAYDASADAPAGYHLVGGIDTVRVNYIKDQTVYTAKFTYVKDAAVPYTVSFDGNGNTSGTVSADKTEASVGAGIELPAALTKTNYVFVGWATTKAKADAGNADAGLAGGRYRPSADITLFAAYRLPQVSFDANGGTGTIAAMSPSAAGGNITVPNGTGLTAPNKKIFDGWNESNDGTGTGHAAGSTMAVTADDILYAVWADLYTVSFDANGGGGTAPTSITQTTKGGAITLPDGTGLTAPAANPTYTFKGWSATQGGTTPVSGYTPAADITLYAIWGA